MGDAIRYQLRDSRYNGDKYSSQVTKMATFSDFIDNVSAVEALSFYEKEEQILREQFGDIEFYRRRDLCMMMARRRRKLILDVHWLNRCLQASCDKQT